MRSKKDKASLYRFFTARGTLLYIGLSHNPFARLAGHKAKPWMRSVRTITIEPIANRFDGMDCEARDYKSGFIAEAKAIARERPRYNIKHQKDLVYAAAVQRRRDEWALIKKNEKAKNGKDKK
jgi:excinuclease UvrABC nuclease subunit